jgi:hypothetical protein
LDLDRFMVRGNMNAQLFKHELVRYYVKVFHNDFIMKMSNMNREYGKNTECTVQD